MSVRKIAFFDFDGTITTKDTLLEIIKFQKGVLTFYIGFLLHAPWLFAYKLKLIPNHQAKQKILSYFFAGTPETEFQDKCDQFSEKVLPSLIRPGALIEINRLRQQGFEIVIISASAGNWLGKWAQSLSLKYIATKMEVINGLITGRIEGKNCHGEQKVNRIRELWNLADFDEIYAFGDSPGDKPMLALANHSFYKPFRSL